MLVHRLGLGSVAEVVQDGVHGDGVAEQRHLGAVGIKELEGLLREVCNGVVLRPGHGGVRQDLRSLQNAVHPEGGHLAVLLRPAHHVIAVAVPGQGVGAEHVGLAAVFELLLFRRGVGKIQEGDFALGVDGLVDGVDEVVDMLVLRLDAVGDRNVPLEPRRGVAAGEGQQLRGQDAALFLGDEL